MAEAAAVKGRWPPPVYSPVSLRALATGLFAAVGLGRGGAQAQLVAALRRRFNAADALLTDSGTSALALALLATQRQRPGAPVALPAYGCYDLATAAAVADVPVVFYDVDPRTLGPDWQSLEAALSAGAGAVVIAYLLGFGVDLDRVAVACRANGAVIIEDAAQGAGGAWSGAPLGSHGSLSVLSFGRGKGVAGGGGGALLARGAAAEWLGGLEESVGPAARGFRGLWALGAQWMLARPLWYAIPSTLPFLRLGETVYREPQAPRAMAAGSSPVVLSALGLGEAEAIGRRERARDLMQAAVEAGADAIAPVSSAEPGYLRFPVLVPRRDARAAARIGVVGAYPQAVSDLPQIADRTVTRGRVFPGALRLASELHTAPTHSRLSDADHARVLQWIRALPRRTAP